MSAPLALTVLALAPLAAAPSLPGIPRGPQDGGGSLEDFLERARGEREALLARLVPTVEALLESVRSSSGRPGDARVSELAALGSEATPLLIPYLDPGRLDPDRLDPGRLDPDKEPDEAQVRVADYAARALARMDPAPVTGELLTMLAHGSPAARIRAAAVLAHVPRSKAVTAALRSCYDESGGELQAACLQALLAHGDERTTALLDGVLRSDRPALIDTALEAVTITRSEASAGAVRALLASPRALRHAAGILAYYLAMPQLADGGVIDDLARLTTGVGPGEVKLAVLAALPRLNPRLSSLKRRLEPLTESRDRDLREGALIALAAMGDRGARRKVLEPYDDLVDRNQNWSQAYSRRATVLLRVGEYDDAIRDFKDALRLAADDPTPDRESHVNLARCYALSGKPREAADWLRRAPISLEDLRALADDPDFASVRDSRFADEAFALEESP